VYRGGQIASYLVERAEDPGPDKLPPRLRIREPVSAIRAPLSTLSLLLPLRSRDRVEPLSPKRRSKLGRLFTTSGRLRIGEEDCSRRGEAYADGDPKEDERDGGGFVGYVSVIRGVPITRGGFEFSDDESGDVICVLTLAKLAGTGDRRNGDSDDDAGDRDSGVLVSDN